MADYSLVRLEELPKAEATEIKPTDLMLVEIASGAMGNLVHSSRKVEVAELFQTSALRLSLANKTVLDGPNPHNVIPEVGDVKNQSQFNNYVYDSLLALDERADGTGTGGGVNIGPTPPQGTGTEVPLGSLWVNSANLKLYVLQEFTSQGDTFPLWVGLTEVAV